MKGYMKENKIVKNNNNNMEEEEEEEDRGGEVKRMEGKMKELEEDQIYLNNEITRLKLLHHHHHHQHNINNNNKPIPPPQNHRSNSLSPLRRRAEDTGRYASPLSRIPDIASTTHTSSSGIIININNNNNKFSEMQYLNILQSMGQAVYIFDLYRHLIYWNKTAEQVFGFSATEALGKDAIELLNDPSDYPMANNIIDRVINGESWKGQFPVKNKRGDKFVVVTTNTPFYDDDGNLTGIISVSSDLRSFKCDSAAFGGSKSSEEASSFSRTKTFASAKLGLDPQQPIQVALASKLSNLATKVSNKVKSKISTGDSNSAYHSDNYNSDHGSDAGNSSGATTPRGDLPQSPFRQFPNEESTYGNEGEKPKIHKILSSRAEAWVAKKGITWPWKGNEAEEPKTSRFSWPWLNNDQENEKKKGLVYGLRSEDHPLGDGFRPTNNEASGSWSSSFNVNSSSSASSCGSTSSEAVNNKADVDSDCLDYEILWEDLAIGEQIGQGSCGIVYHALWYGSDVAVKVFSKQEYSNDVILSFRQEVSLMKKLRHPNVLLFMGAVTSPQRLCIITEFLPRGSLFRILQRGTSRLDWKRRAQMALDIARGMNYLHHCNPPIVHRDLKSSNLLVDKSWTVKVGDFGLSRLKREAYLTTKSGKGTPQWMAPEVLRNEQADEKSDIYSYGVILWELVTQKIPWENLNSMQVIGAVGFMDQRLDLPKDIDPQWASLIESCWHSEPQCRPTSQELLDRLKDMQKQYTNQFQVARSAGDGSKVL